MKNKNYKQVTLLFILLIVLGAGVSAFAYFHNQNYNKANDDLDLMKYEQHDADSLKEVYPKTHDIDSLISYHLSMVQSFKEDFNETVGKVSDKQKQLELIKKFDRIYVLRIEK